MIILPLIAVTPPAFILAVVLKSKKLKGKVKLITLVISSAIAILFDIVLIMGLPFLCFDVCPNTPHLLLFGLIFLAYLATTIYTLKTLIRTRSEQTPKLSNNYNLASRAGLGD